MKGCLSVENKLLEIFTKIFSAQATDRYFAPGRINLIGEHTDYNGGNVFPAAISLGTYALVKKREDTLLRFYSLNFEELGIITVDLKDVSYKKSDDWTNYPKGIFYLLQQKGYTIQHGLDILYYGNIPNGAGLSSSASIELVTGVLANDQFHLGLEQLDLVYLGQQVENQFIGVQSGIMDQFAIGMGKQENAMLLNTNTMEYELVPAKFNDCTIVIMNTNKRRELADSKYNERRAECEKALTLIQQKYTIQSLGEMSEDMLLNCQDVLSEETLFKRAKHAVLENLRTLEAKKALETGDLLKFGQLLNESHQSLKEDYEVTGIELDTLVEAAQKQSAVLGARMTGAGFGGCAIALVKTGALDEVIEAVSTEYRQHIGYDAAFYQAAIANGAQKLDNQ